MRATRSLALDMYEHAYHLDFGANATAYVDAFMRNVNWAAVIERMTAIRADRALPQEDPSDTSLPSMSMDLMEGAQWRDPDRVEEWIGELSTDQPVAVYYAYGFHVGCNVTRTLRERRFDARYIRGGVSAWYAAGGARAMRPVAS